MVAIGATCMILGEQDALMAIETRLWRMDRPSVNEACVRASANVKHAGKEGLACMLMAPGSSGWVAGATGSRSPEGADGKCGPEVDLRAVCASDEAHVPDETASSSSTAYCHTKPRKKPCQHYESMLREH